MVIQSLHRNVWVFILLCLLDSLCIRVSNAQISPGELTKSHAHLEGMLNCTKCHVLGDK